MHIHAEPTVCQDGVTNNCTQNCTRSVFNGISSYECGCREGFELNPDNTTCDDIDECASDKHNCLDRMNCSDTIGGYECKFNKGYNSSIELEGIDECVSNPCHPNATCTNQLGTFICECKTGYEGNGSICQLEETQLPTPNINSEQDTVIISSTLGAVAFLLLVTVVVVILICIFRKFFGITRRKSDLLFSSSVGHHDSSISELPVVDLDPHPRTISVQSSYRLNLPRHLLICASDIKLVEPVGQGEFGIVYKGYIVKEQGSIVTDTVAIKTLKGLYNRNTVRDMLKECATMYKFHHSNVLTLKGVCLDGGTAPYIVMPFMANGSLLAYLKKNRETLVVSLDNEDEDDVMTVQKRLMDMCIQVAKGMEYLASKRMVHRDLAARNCMIDMNFVIKVADFGLSESLEIKQYFRQEKSSHIKLPLKWLAPESMDDYVFSEKSDVWAYGVTCWEIFSGGKVPYGGVDVTDLSRLLANGYRLDKPNNDACSDQLYQLIVQCWELEPVNRPTFANIVSALSDSLQAMAGYMDIGAFGETTVVINKCTETLEELVALTEEHSSCQALSAKEEWQNEAHISDESTV